MGRSPIYIYIILFFFVAFLWGYPKMDGLFLMENLTDDLGVPYYHRKPQVPYNTSLFLGVTIPTFTKGSFAHWFLSDTSCQASIPLQCLQLLSFNLSGRVWQAKKMGSMENQSKSGIDLCAC